MQNKEKLIFKIFALVLAVFSFCTLNMFASNNVVLAEQDDFTVITSLDQITDMSGKYRLQQKEGAYSYSASLGKFSGTLDGNDCIISYSAGTDFDVTQPLFNSLDNGAVVYNICFAPTESDVQNVYFGASDIANQKTSYGLLASNISNSEVYGIQFANTNAYVYDNEALTSVPELSVGLLAGQISGSKVHQIKISNCSILPYSKEEATSNIRSNFNIGMIAGKANNGTKLQNNLILQSTLSVSVADTITTNHNLGIVAGLVESGYITNNILGFISTTPLVSVNFKGTNKALNFGYIAGKTASADVSLFNNVLNLNQDTILSSVEEETYAGLIVGNMSTNLSTEDLQGFITTFEGKYVGTMDNDALLASYANISKIDLETLFVTKIHDTTLWNNIYAWDFDKVWKATSTSALPTLQYFEDYSISFSSLDSVKSLSIEKLPTLSDATLNVVNSNFTLLNVDNTASGDKLDVPYGKAVKLSTFVTNLNNFSKFFKISGLLLNGVKIFDYNYDTNVGTSYNGYQVTGAPNAETGNFDFVISDFTASNAGTYSVQLLRNVFKLKINVLELDVNGQSILPGKVKSNMASDGSSEIVVDMQYGTKYTYETYDVNSDYAKEADWFLYNLEPNNAEFVFDLDSLSTRFVSQNNLEWTFDENCVLFGSGDAEDTTDYLSLDNYYYNKDNLEDENNNIFAVSVLFSKDVKDIEIRFKFDDEEEILEKVADVVIDDGAVSLTYVEGEGYYKAKIRYSNKTHIISLKGVSTDYQFDGWYLNSRMPQATNDLFGGTFEIVNDGDASTVVIYAVFTKEKVNDAGNMLWLWLTLAGVGVLLITVIVIVVIKKKKAGASSYKKYMY